MKLVLLALFAILPSSNLYAEWKDVKSEGSPLSFKNSTKDAKLRKVTFPRVTGSLLKKSVSFSIKTSTYLDCVTLAEILAQGGFRADCDETAGKNRVDVRIEVKRHSRMNDLFDYLNRFEAIQPESELVQMKVQAADIIDKVIKARLVHFLEKHKNPPTPVPPFNAEAFKKRYSNTTWE
jgi:hypothetical protein